MYSLRLLLCCYLILLFGHVSRAQCLDNATVFFSEDFEGESRASLTAQGWLMTTPAGGSNQFQVNNGTVNGTANPGNNAWIFLEDGNGDQADDLLTSPVFDLSTIGGDVQLRVDILSSEDWWFGVGRSFVEVWDQPGGNWVTLYTLNNYFSGTLDLEVTPYKSAQFRLRFRFDDEGDWADGWGIDNFTILDMNYTPACGSGVCDAGEDPMTCPGDCPVNPAPGTFIPLGQDLDGNVVTYTAFQGGLACDDCSELVSLNGWLFDFYGTLYDEVFLNSNGNLTFDAGYTAYSPASFCVNGPVMIAPFWADVDISNGGTISYYQGFNAFGHYLIVTWEQVEAYSIPAYGLVNSFQVILLENTVAFGYNTEFRYGDMQWTTGTANGGAGGFGTLPATVGVNQGDGLNCDDYGIFNHEGHDYLGPSQGSGCGSAGVSHLDYTSITIDASSGLVTPLAYTLAAWTGEAHALGITLRWQVTQAEGLSHFVVERLEPGGEISLVGVQQAGGVALGDYALLDRQARPGPNHYRLRGVDQAGQVTYSPVLTVYGPGVAGSFSLGGQPGAPHVFCRTEGGELVLEVFDLQGRRMQRLRQTLPPGPQDFALPGSLPPGTYGFRARLGQQHWQGHWVVGR